MRCTIVHPGIVYKGSFSACTWSCTFECTVWRVCKLNAPSRVQWYPKTAPSRVQCVFFPCGVRVRPPLVLSGTPKLHPLVFSVFCFRGFLLPAAYTSPSRRETQKTRYKQGNKEITIPIRVQFESLVRSERETTWFVQTARPRLYLRVVYVSH